MKPRLMPLILCALPAVMGACADHALAQTFPTKLMRLIVPFSPAAAMIS